MSSGIYNGLNDGLLNGLNDGLLTGTANGLYSNINNSLEKEAIKLISVGRFSSNEIIAVNTLIKSFKRFNLWDKYYAIYPFLGATASSCKWNIKDIRDEDSAFRLIYPYGSSYFNFTNYGMEFTGVQNASYAVTNLIPSIVFKGSDAFSMGCYVNGGTLTGGPFPATMGTLSTADKEQALSLRTSGKYFVFQGEVLSYVSTSNTNYTGFFYGNSAPVGSNATLFRNQTVIGTQLVTDATKLSTNPMWLGNSNVDGSSNWSYSNVRMGIALIGKSLNSAEYSLLQMTIQQFVKSLNRE